VRRGPSGRALEVIERPGKAGRFGDRRTMNENLQDSLVIYDWQRGWRGESKTNTALVRCLNPSKV
jgi:hypothetical protein